MRHFVAAALIAVAAAFSSLPAHADQDTDVFNRIEELHGNAQAFEEAFYRLTQALNNDDAAELAGISNFPLRVQANGESYDVLEAQDLIDNYGSLIMQETKDAVANQRYGDLFVNSEGVMVGNAVWLSAVCDNNSCSRSHWAVIAINN